MPGERNVPRLVKEKLTRRWRRAQGGRCRGGGEGGLRRVAEGGGWRVAEHGTERRQLINCKLVRLEEK